MNTIEISNLAQAAGLRPLKDGQLDFFQQKFKSVESEYSRRYKKDFSIQTVATQQVAFTQSLFFLTPPMCIAVLRLTDNRKILSIRYEYKHESSSELTVVIGLVRPYDDNEDAASEEFTSSSLDDIEFFKLLYSASVNQLPSVGFFPAYPHLRVGA